jgi:hypothetical protein
MAAGAANDRMGIQFDGLSTRESTRLQDFLLTLVTVSTVRFTDPWPTTVFVSQKQTDLHRHSLRKHSVGSK